MSKKTAKVERYWVMGGTGSADIDLSVAGFSGIFGDNRNNILNGGSGDDSLQGLDGHDTLEGNARVIPQKSVGVQK